MPQQEPAVPAIQVAATRSRSEISPRVVFDIDDLNVTYGKTLAVTGVNLEIHEKAITALIGPSGCGKSTVLRCLNRMNDLVPNAKVGGKLFFHGVDLYGSDVDPIEVRRRIGMVFQRPNPFPKSIYDNVAYGLRILGMKDDLDGRVERALRSAAIEDLMHDLKREYTLVIVTHNMQQAARVAEMTAFFSLDVHEDGTRNGVLVEYDSTEKIFTQPADERTEGYVTGRFG